MRNYCNFRPIVTVGYFIVILFYPVSKVFEKELFFLALRRRVYFSRRNKISTITYVCTRQERQTPVFGTCAKFRQVDPTIPMGAVGGGGRVKGIFAIALSSCLLRWRIGLIEIPDVFGAATCVRVCSLCVCSNPSLLSVKIELVILIASAVHFGISEEKYRDERPTIKLLSSTSIVRTSSLPSYNRTIEREIIWKKIAKRFQRAS